MKRLVVIFLFLSSLYSCKEDGEDLAPNFEGYQYFPLEIGQTSIFKIDSIVYDDFTQEIDTFSFFLKEEIESTFIDGANRKSYRVAIYYSLDTSNWRLQKVISKLRIDLRAEKTEENVTIVPLVFPIKQTSVWDLNILNTREEVKCRFKDINQSFNDYDSTITVAQEEEISLIERKTSEEVYAANVGLVYTRKQDLKLDFSTAEIRSGYDLKKSLLSYK